MHFTSSILLQLYAIALAQACQISEPRSSGQAPTRPPSPPVGDTSSSIFNVDQAAAQIYRNNKLCAGSGGSENCTSQLAATQTTSDSSCSLSTSQHLWPIGGLVTDCHGWSATDTSGKVHYNSANSIQCSCDGLSMTYTQYPDSLNCSGSGHQKSFTLDACNQGMPPTLYDRALDLSCCTAQDHCVSVLEDDTGSAGQADWLQGGYDEPTLTADDKKYWITIGMSSNDDCSDIGNRTVLTLYVGPNMNETCQGWNHYPNPYPDTSTPHANSAVNVHCVDGGVTYDQYTNIECSGGSAKTKTDNYEQCHQGFTPTVYTEILDFSGCLNQGFSPLVPKVTMM